MAISEALARELEQHFNVEPITDKLHEYPVLLQKAKEVVLEKKETLAEARNELSYVESNLALDIASEVDPKTGKPLYTNQQARDAMLVISKNNSEEYKEAQDAVRKAMNEYESAEFDLQRLQDEFSAYLHVARIIEGRLKLFAS